MTAIQEERVLSEAAQELYAVVPPQYLITLRHLLGLVPKARIHFERGNVLKAFGLLNEADKVQIAARWKLTKERMLELITLGLPSTYQSDLDPDDADSSDA